MFINSHIHIFHGIKDVPDRFFGKVLMMLLRGNKSFKVIAKILHTLNPFSSKDEFDRYLSFAKTGRLAGQKEIFEKIQTQYPTDTKFVILPMDMAYMGAGYVERDYPEQLQDLKEVRDAYPDSVIPFIAVDCRRPNINDLFRTAIDNWKFKGVKLYPPLGTFPFDSRYFIIAFPYSPFSAMVSFPKVKPISVAITGYRFAAKPKFSSHFGSYGGVRLCG